MSEHTTPTQTSPTHAARAGWHASERGGRRPAAAAGYVVTAAVALALGAGAMWWVNGQSPRAASDDPIVVDHSAHAAAAADAVPAMDAGSDAAGGVYISPVRQQLIGVRTAEVAPRTLGGSLRGTGTLAYDGHRCCRCAAAILRTEEGYMRGHQVVIDKLNEAIREELTAINQYFVHAEMCHNWGYHRLGNYIKKQSLGEMKHAEELMERILFLDGTPTMEPLPLKIGKDVRAQLQNDCDLEVKAVGMYNDAIRVAREAGDNASRELFERLLKDEEEHVDFLEAQLHQIQEIGYERYLSQQLGGSED